MPADYRSTAEGLAVSPDRQGSSPSPPWSRATPSADTSSRRLSSARVRLPTTSSFSSASNNLPWHRQAWTKLESLNDQVMRTFWRMTPLQRAIAVLAILAGYAILILGWIYSHSFFGWLSGVSASWRELPAGWLIVFSLVFVSAFPPMIGYSTFNTIAGFVYGFPYGWPIVAIACTLGSLAAFYASRTVLSKSIDRMVGKDPRFVALGQVLKQDGILYLTGIRFCPLPFSLSNGFLATIPSITPMSFAISTALSTPKLLVHIFIGSRLAVLAENGDEMSFGDRMINYLSMAVSGAVGLTVGWIVYKRTMARAAELARETSAEEGYSHRSYIDAEDTLMDPEDAAALMSDDDLSLWETQVNGDEGYRDGDFDEDWSKPKSKPTQGGSAGRV
jgi:uncharacterized membrane protein YdjX (TVP38/TMEM64 family)